MWYEFLNIFSFIIHTAFILFNLVGWAFPITRKLHLITILLTAFSWFVLGIWYGWGYCACTDWHWQIRKALGYKDPPDDSFIHFLLRQLTGKDLNKQMLDATILSIFILTVILSVWLNINDRRKKGRR